MAKSKTKKSKVEPIDLGEGPVTPIGVDASWTGLAVCALEQKKWGAWQVRLAEVLTTKPGDFPSKSARLEKLGYSFMVEIAMATGRIDDGPCSSLVAIEGYAMGVTYGREMSGELGGHLRLLLWQAGIPYIIVPPSSLKTYILNGPGKKNLVLKAVYKRWGYDVDCDDQADAYGLARIAAEFAAGNWTKKFEALAQGFEVVAAKGVRS